MTRLDCHWVEMGTTAQAELVKQGYEAMDYRLGPPISTPRGSVVHRPQLVNMCKSVEVDE